MADMDFTYSCDESDYLSLIKVSDEGGGFIYDLRSDGTVAAFGGITSEKAAILIAGYVAAVGTANGLAAVSADGSDTHLLSLEVRVPNEDAASRSVKFDQSGEYTIEGSWDDDATGFFALLAPALVSAFSEESGE